MTSFLAAEGSLRGVVKKGPPCGCSRKPISSGPCRSALPLLWQISLLPCIIASLCDASRRSWPGLSKPWRSGAAHSRTALSSSTIPDTGRLVFHRKTVPRENNRGGFRCQSGGFKVVALIFIGFRGVFVPVYRKCGKPLSFELPWKAPHFVAFPFRAPPHFFITRYKRSQFLFFGKSRP